MGKSSLSSTSPPSRSRQGRGPGDPGRRQPAAPRGQQRPEIGETEMATRGSPSPIPTLGWGALEGRIDGQRRADRGGGRGGAGGGDGGLGAEEEMVVEVRGATESHAGPFIGAGRR
jgi:hypothetical protein